MSEAQQQKGAEGATEVADGNDFTSLLSKEFKPQSNRAKEEVEAAVATLAQQALATSATVSTDTVASIQAIIAEIDRKLSAQVNEILHHKDLQALEGSWRGLHYLVNNSETDTMLKIRVMNVSKKDMQKTLKRFKGAAWDQSPVFKKLYEEEYGQLGGEPYACVVADYFFDQSAPDVETLGELAKIGAACHSPVLSAAAPSLFGMENWQELGNPRDLQKIFSTPDYAAWRSLRDAEDSRYLGITLPRFLARRPYGAKSDPVEEFDFEEETNGPDASKYTWSNSAYAMAVNINRSYKLYGWCSRIRGIEAGGAVEGLPTHTFPNPVCCCSRQPPASRMRADSASLPAAPSIGCCSAGSTKGCMTIATTRRPSLA